MARATGKDDDASPSKKKTEAASEHEEGVVGAGGARWRILALEDLPEVPDDRKEVIAAAAKVTRRFAKASWTEGVEGLKEIAARGRSNPGELGDLAPATEEAGASAAVLTRVSDVVSRLESLLEYHRAVQALEEQSGSGLIDECAEAAEARIARGRIPAESYPNLRKFAAAHGESVAQGRAQAQAVREAEKRATDASKPK